MRRGLLAAGLMLGLVLGGWGRPAPGGDAPPSFHGIDNQFIELRPLERPPPAPITRGDGRTVDLGDFRGRVVLLNIWATWCEPCVWEMPALDRLQGALGGERFEVVALSIDRDGMAAVEPFFRRHGVKHLGMYLDPGRRTAYTNAANPNGAAFPVYGLPITFLIDRQGRVAGYVTGPAQWHSEDAKRLIRHYIEHPQD
ncbi:MAG: TlpA disulfide reductase family protein [Rhodospirillales bacterium]|nr:TlpA disulfide reductase family protein [Rhodospirillales bacterium]